MKGKLWIYALLSGVLLTLAWPVKGFPFLLFIGFIPLLLLQHTISADNRLRARQLFFYSYVSFLIWNLGTTWWIWFASPGGAAMAILCNALLMAFTFLAFHKIKRALPERIGSYALLPVWIAFEYLHFDWDLSWPWLTLGNGFASWNQLVQWYEYTGILGGSFWILLVNVLLFELYIHRNTYLRPFKRKVIVWTTLGVVLLVPAIISLTIYFRMPVNEGDLSIRAVVVQPNIDPYRKFSSDFREQLERMISLAEKNIDSATNYIVMPETAIVEDLWENKMTNSWSVHRLFSFRSNYPGSAIVSGASTARYYEEGQPLSSTARKFKSQPGYFDHYNTALQFDTTHQIPVYHKSKLVPGVEKMPFPKYFKYLENFAIDLGGTSGSLGMQDERTVFYHPADSTGIAPVICYESIYGDYVSEYIRNGADFIFIITNDGWWGDTPGYRQHLAYGTLRAIESRKSIARAANTGISCFINKRGDIEQPQSWWTASSAVQNIYSDKGFTFYTRFGDYIGVIMLYLALGGAAWFIIRLIAHKLKRKNIP